jgi:hypothetical protein
LQFVSANAKMFGPIFHLIHRNVIAKWWRLTGQSELWSTSQADLSRAAQETVLRMDGKIYGRADR